MKQTKIGSQNKVLQSTVAQSTVAADAMVLERATFQSKKAYHYYKDTLFSTSVQSVNQYVFRGCIAHPISKDSNFKLLKLIHP